MPLTGVAVFCTGRLVCGEDCACGATDALEELVFDRTEVPWGSWG